MATIAVGLSGPNSWGVSFPALAIPYVISAFDEEEGLV